MRISELARASEVSVATIKFYLREGLLPEGRLTSATQAQYEETHVARLRLIRALIGPGGLSLAAARRVIAAIEDPPPDGVHALLGVATTAVGRAGEPGDHERVHALMREWGWRVEEKDCPGHDELERALAALDDARFPLPPGALDHYAGQLSAVAKFEIDTVPTGSVEAAVRYVVLGTILVEPLLLALRRLAHVEMSARRFGPGAP